MNYQENIVSEIRLQYTSKTKGTQLFPSLKENCTVTYHHIYQNNIPTYIPKKPLRYFCRTSTLSTPRKGYQLLYMIENAQLDQGPQQFFAIPDRRLPSCLCFKVRIQVRSLSYENYFYPHVNMNQKLVFSVQAPPSNFAASYFLVRVFSSLHCLHCCVSLTLLQPHSLQLIPNSHYTGKHI